MFCVTVSYGQVSGKAKKYPYWQPALYRKTQLKNGRTVWYYVKHLWKARRSIILAEQDAKQYAADHNDCLFIKGIRHLNNYE